MTADGPTLSCPSLPLLTGSEMVGVGVVVHMLLHKEGSSLASFPKHKEVGRLLGPSAQRCEGQ